MKAPLFLSVLITAALVSDASAQERTAPPSAQAEAKAPEPATREAAPANADALLGFGFDLYRQHAAQHAGENVALSPVCLASLLDALLAGADGKTAAELRRVLRQAPGESVPASSSMPASDPAAGLTVRQAMGIWLSPSIKARAEFLSTVKEKLKASAENIDFSKSDEAAKEINAWVAEATENKIPTLVTASEFNEQTRLAAVSALYFKAPWADKFDPAKTKPGNFQPGSGKPVSTPLMQGKIKTRFVEWPNGTKALALDFQGGALTFLALLPRDTAGLPALEASLTPEFLHAINGALHQSPVEVTLPRFAINASAPPRPLLEGLGVDTLFREADLSQLTNDRDLVVSTMNHKVSVSVDEAGAEGAAAASAVVMSKGVVSTKQFVADRPFVFVIMQRESLAPLMVGRLANPAAAEETPAVAKSTTRKGAVATPAPRGSPKATPSGENQPPPPSSTAPSSTPPAATKSATKPRQAVTPRPVATPLGVVTPSPGTTPRKR